LRLFVMHNQLLGRAAHPYTESLGWVRACADRSIELHQFGSARMPPEVAQETGAAPLFYESWEDLARYASREDSAGAPDPYSGVLEWFLRYTHVIARGCHEAWIGAPRKPDVVVFPWTDAGVANGAAEWLLSVGAKERPKVLFNVVRPEPTWRLDAQRDKASGDFSYFRLASRRLRNLTAADGLVFTAVDPRLARLLSHVTQTECLPAPLHQPYPDRDFLSRLTPRRSGDEIMIGVMGPLRDEKGLEQVADVITAVCGRHPAARFRLQVTSEKRAAAFVASLDVSGSADRVIVHIGSLERDAYFTQMLESDVILTPYVAQQYAMMPSGVFGEALALGLPVVTPQETWMSDRLAEGWGAGETFPANASPEGIAEATTRAIEAREALRTRAMAGAAAWRRAQSLDAYIDHVLALLA
jgi:glycosyltransferase involved in cell wall biosynthesis